MLVEKVGVQTQTIAKDPKDLNLWRVAAGPDLYFHADGSRDPDPIHYWGEVSYSSQKWHLEGPKMAERVWKGVYPLVLGHSCQLLQNKFFDPSPPSIRKGRNGEEKLEKMEGKKWNGK